MINREEKTSEEMVAYCGLQYYTESPSDIKLPIFIMDDLLLAQDHAVSIVKGVRHNTGWTYRLRISDAKFESIDKRMILKSGNIEIMEILTIEYEDGMALRKDRKVL